MNRTALAVGCHPDDIEFMMAGTLMRLADAGYDIHYLNVANGCCGTDRLPPEEIIQVRREESMAAAKLVGAVYHESLANDIEVFYTTELLGKVGAVIRQVAPEIILTHSPNEYMEDHMNTCRLTVTAAFCRGMSNVKTIPPVETLSSPVTLYHAMPYGLCDQLGKALTPQRYVDVSTKVEAKKAMLACHKSQKEWLDVSQGEDAYLHTLEKMSRDMGALSGRYDFAEGWWRHSHLGFCSPEDDPLAIVS